MKDSESQFIGDIILKIVLNVFTFIRAALMGLTKLKDIRVILTSIILVVIGMIIKLYRLEIINLIDSLNPDNKVVFEEMYLNFFDYFIRFLPIIFVVVYLATVGMPEVGNTKKEKVK